MDTVAQSISIAQARLGDFMPDVAVILGSGLGAVADAVEGAIEIPFSDLAGFPETSISGHGGALVFGTLGQTPVVVLKGRAHYYEHGEADVMAVPLKVLHGLGCSKIILTNSAGSLIEDVRPGELMLITDHINMSGTSPLIGKKGDAQFVDLSQAYDLSIQDKIRVAATTQDISLGEGVYVWMSGPQFETPAEIRMLRLLGGGAVGMSTVPEVIIARQLGLKVGVISSITNMGAGMEAGELGHDQTLEGAKAGAEKLTRLLGTLFEGDL